MSESLPPAALAFDAVAPDFDRRFGKWLSVLAQRTAVRRALVEMLPRGGRVLELGGGTGEDAAWLAARGYDVLHTDPSPRMVTLAASKLAPHPRARTLVAAAESLDAVAQDPDSSGAPPFDGAFSNFAALNCVTDLAAVGRGLARLVRPGGIVALVLFGPFAPGEFVVELARFRPRAALRRLSRGAVAARLGGHHFTVRYHRPGEIEAAMAPWLRPIGRRGIGVFVPPSAAEPWISRHPRLLRMLEALDERAATRLALLGDHVMYCFERTAVSAA